MSAARLRRPEVIVGLLLLTVLFACAVAPGWLAPHNATRMVVKLKFLPPAWIAGGNPDYLLGTDQAGRDLLSRLIYGANTSLTIAASAVAVSALLGVTLGLFAGYFRGWIDTVVMRLADVQLASPHPLALAILRSARPRARSPSSSCSGSRLGHPCAGDARAHAGRAREGICPRRPRPRRLASEDPVRLHPALGSADGHRHRVDRARRPDARRVDPFLHRPRHRSSGGLVGTIPSTGAATSRSHGGCWCFPARPSSSPCWR